MPRFTRILTAAAAMAMASAAHAAPFLIDTAKGTFTPSFRGEANTTHFGWAEGTFDANPDPGPEGNSERLYPRHDLPVGLNPQTPTIGAYPVGNLGDFYQNNYNATPAGLNNHDILSSTNNIYTSGNSTFDATMIIPTNGVLDTGYTTIIIQGKALPSVRQIPDFLAIMTDDGWIEPASVEYALNDQDPSAYLQFWVMYQLAGNELVYALQMQKSGLGHGNPISIAHLEVDTYWSPTAFAADTAFAPEPASMGLLGLFACGILARRRRNPA